MVADVPSERVFRVYGMRRSGNHAIIDWIMRNAPGGNGLFLNNCRHGHDPIATARLPKIYRDGVGEHVNLKRDVSALQAMSFVVVSYEDVPPPADDPPLFDAPETVVVIYRSFENWAASMLAKLQANSAHSIIDRFRLMNRAFGLYRLTLETLERAAVTPFWYDGWLSDPQYRADMRDTLTLSGSDMSLGDIQSYGGGSSFGESKPTDAEDRQLHRYLEMAGDWEFETLMDIARRDQQFQHTLDHVFPLRQYTNLRGAEKT